MKKILFSLSILLFAVCATVAISSCSKDDEGTDKYVMYTWDTTGYQDNIFLQHLDEVYGPMFRSLGATSVDSIHGRAIFVASGSEKDATVKAACEAAKTEVDKHVTVFDVKKPCTVIVTRTLTNNESTDVEIYRQDFIW